MALININYESKTLGMPVMINAIIPQGRGSYKTLYLLHGMGGDYTTWITKSRVADYVDNTDIAVIMISGDNKCYVDNVHGRKYFTFLTEELIETCTNWFGLSCDRKDRYIAGMSMGGYGAVHAALIKPDVYGKVFSYSGLLDIEKRFFLVPSMTSLIFLMFLHEQNKSNVRSLLVEIKFHPFLKLSLGILALTVVNWMDEYRRVKNVASVSSPLNQFPLNQLDRRAQFESELHLILA